MIFKNILSSLRVKVGILKSTHFARVRDDRLREPFLVFEVGKLHAVLVLIQLAILDPVLSPAVAAENPFLVRRRAVNDSAFGSIFVAGIRQRRALSRTLL